MNVSDVNQRVDRWRKLFDSSSPVRRVFLVYGGDDENMPPIEHTPAHPEKAAGRIETAWQNYQRQVSRAEWLDDDTIPYVDTYSGTEIFAAAFGCEVHRYAGGGTAARPLVSDASEAAALKVPDISHPALAVLFEIGDELRRRAGDDALMKIPDIQSPIDIAALIWEKTSFYYAMVDAPAAVKELAEKCRQLLIAFCDEWFDRYGRQFIAHYPAYYMPTGLTLSEDEIGSVNREMAEEFFLPHLNALSDHFGGLGIHCCANARHQWDNFLKIRNLRVLNLTRDAETTADAYRFFGDSVIHVHDGQPSDDPATWIAENAPEAPAVVRYWAEDRDQAVELARRLRAWAEP